MLAAQTPAVFYLEVDIQDRPAITDPTPEIEGLYLVLLNIYPIKP